MYLSLKDKIHNFGHPLQGSLLRRSNKVIILAA